MLKHEDLWNGIDRLAEKFGYSASGLAKHAGLDPTTFNPSKRKQKDGSPRWLSMETLARTLNAVGYTLSDFAALFEEEQPAPTEQTLE